MLKRRLFAQVLGVVIRRARRNITGVGFDQIVHKRVAGDEAGIERGVELFGKRNGQNGERERMLAVGFLPFGLGRERHVAADFHERQQQLAVEFQQILNCLFRRSVFHAGNSISQYAQGLLGVNNKFTYGIILDFTKVVGVYKLEAWGQFKRTVTQPAQSEGFDCHDRIPQVVAVT